MITIISSALNKIDPIELKNPPDSEAVGVTPGLYVGLAKNA